ncbi:CynX/NimT family MFS transporter [Phaeacidiphilus oryzae]|uniref:CynX/NimT family MFS transporter n=1 Tax=Phaeacidiphilus oryzae TaxID=348818 RepID=UPI00068B788E|nr:MFS transporter [Phaeacidiphilus oryzae]
MKTQRVATLVGIVLVAVNMRAAMSAVSPLLGDVSGSYRLGSTAAGLLTTLPVLFLGLVAPLVPRAARRFGTERVVLGGLLLLAVGIAVRVLPGSAALYAGSMVIGAGIAVLNVTMPGLVKRDFPDRAAAMTGLYSTVMIAGSTLAAALSVPMERLFGGHWQGSLASWSLPALVAAGVWLPQVSRGRRGPGAPGPGTVGAVAGAAAAGAAATGAGHRVPGLWRSRLAWQLAVYMGICSLLAYTLIAWYPTVLVSHGMDRGTAGLVFAFCNLVQIVGSFTVPLLAGRMRSQRPLVAAMIGCYAVGVAGLMAAPADWSWGFAVPLGLAMGGAFGLALAMIVLRAQNAVVAAEVSGMSQLVGYLIAAVGPVGVGALHQATGGWAIPAAVLLAACGVGLVAGLGGARDLVLRTDGRTVARETESRTVPVRPASPLQEAGRTAS